MIAQTAGVMVFFALLALTRRQNGAAIGVLVASMLVWPEYLRVPVGLSEMSAPRFVAIVLVVRSIATGQHRSIKLTGSDRIVLAVWIWTVLASVLAGSSFPHVSQMIGRGLDTVLIYFAFRLCISTKDDLFSLGCWLLLVAIVMGGLGILESFTTRSPYAGMEAFRPWAGFDKEDQFRHGFLRAKASTSIHIYYGMAMVLVTGMLWALRAGFPEMRFGRVGVLLGIGGVLSSMSSGPWLGCALTFAFGLFVYRPSLIRPSLYFMVFMAVVLEIASNRHFYNLIDYMALDPHTAWYRTRLLEVAASNLSEFWLVGVGSQWPQHWGPMLDGRGHIDVVNNFLVVALHGGLPALFLYCVSHLLAVRYVIAFWRTDPHAPIQRAAFRLACVLVALDVSSMSVGLYGPPLLLSFALLALIVSIAQLQETTHQAQEISSLNENGFRRIRE